LQTIKGSRISQVISHFRLYIISTALFFFCIKVIKIFLFVLNLCINCGFLQAFIFTLPTLDVIIKRTKATKTGLSSVTTRLVDTVESVIRRFSHVFESRDAIIAAVTSPKYKLKWVESQEKTVTNKCFLKKCAPKYHASSP